VEVVVDVVVLVDAKMAKAREAGHQSPSLVVSSKKERSLA
jgi:hypothetical protein